MAHILGALMHGLFGLPDVFNWVVLSITFGVMFKEDIQGTVPVHPYCVDPNCTPRMM